MLIGVVLSYFVTPYMAIPAFVIWLVLFIKNVHIDTYKAIKKYLLKYTLISMLFGIKFPKHIIKRRFGNYVEIIWGIDYNTKFPKVDDEQGCGKEIRQQSGGAYDKQSD